MTVGSRLHRPGKPPNQVSRAWFDHSSAERVNTDTVLVDAIRTEYPNLHLTVVPSRDCDILAYASAGHAAVAPIDTEKERLSWRVYAPPASRLTGKGQLTDQVHFGKYLIDWKSQEFVCFVADARDGTGYYPVIRNQYLLSPSVDATNALVLEAGQYSSLLHNEVWIFDGGFWGKSRELWDSVQKVSTLGVTCFEAWVGTGRAQWRLFPKCSGLPTLTYAGKLGRRDS